MNWCHARETAVKDASAGMEAKFKICSTISGGKMARGSVGGELAIIIQRKRGYCWFVLEM